MRIIAGPCQHESIEQSLEIALHCRDVCKKYELDYYFKASYDKANRFHNDSKRGLGLHPTMIDFNIMKMEYKDLKIVSDVHETEQLPYIVGYLDVIQIPAFLCRQTDLIKAACKTGLPVMIKKGQFLAPWDVPGIISKCEDASEVWIVERGTSFGYNNLVVDFTGINWMLDNLPTPLVMDCTHSTQRPGGLGTGSGGNRDYVPGLARAASAMGVRNFFLEVHPDPDTSGSDGPSMIYLDKFEEVIDQIVEYNYDSR